jgi:glycerol-3-phosphate dehydrogenase (NAD(P)+)
MDDIARTKQNARYVPDVGLDGVTPTASLETALDGVPLVIAAVPSHGMRDVLRAAAPSIRRDAVIVSATKGLETTSLARMSQVIADEAGGRPIAVLSGPSFALEVARGLPTAVVVASTDASAAARVQENLKGPALRLYGSDDVAGVEFGGALKNVIAIAAGISDGLGFGLNARSAVITRGLAEISRIAVALGANPLTLMGLAGLGDLVLTCTGDLSRNRRVGIELGKGRSLEEILGEMTQVAEGVKTARSARDLSRKVGVELPICDQVHAIMYEGKSPRRALVELMTRAPKRED